MDRPVRMTPSWFARRTARQALGERSEQLAVRWLQDQGYRLCERNVRFPVGEIDIVAQEGDTLCFVEVRSTSSLAWGGPLVTITPQKQQRLIRAGQWYLQRLRRIPEHVRFDVVSVEWNDAAAPRVELIRGAFEVGG